MPPDDAPRPGEEELAEEAAAEAEEAAARARPPAEEAAEAAEPPRRPPSPPRPARARGRRRATSRTRLRRRRRRGVLGRSPGARVAAKQAEAPAQLAGRARHDRRGRARPGARDPGVPRQAVPHPERVDGADARDRPARARRPRELPLQRPGPRRHRRLQAAAGAAERLRRASAPSDQPCPEGTPERSDTNFIKRVVGLPGDHLKVLEGSVYINGKSRTSRSPGSTPTAPPATSRGRSRSRTATTT